MLLNQIHKNLIKNSKIKKVLQKNINYFFILLKNKSSSFLKNFNIKIFVKFNILRFNFYIYLFWNYFLLNLNRYHYITKLHYMYTTKLLGLKNYNLYLYLNTLDDSKNTIIKLQSSKLKLIFSRKRKKIVDMAKLKRVVSIFEDYHIPWQLINLSLTKVSVINYNIFWAFKKFNSVRHIGINKPLFLNLYNQNYIISGYLNLKYGLYRKFNFPYNVYYTHENEVTIFDVFLFLNKFRGMFTKSGNKLFANNLIKYFNITANIEGFNFYKLIKFFIFNYVPFVHLKVSLINRRRITKPTLLTKDKSFFLAIKWWREAAIVRKERSVARGLFLELLDINLNKGIVVNKFNQLLLSTYNARSDLRVKGRKNKLKSKKDIFFNIKRRRYLNEFIYNSKWTKSYFIKFRSLYSNKVIKDIDYFNRVLLNKSYNSNETTGESAVINKIVDNKFKSKTKLKTNNKSNLKNKK